MRRSSRKHVRSPSQSCRGHRDIETLYKSFKDDGSTFKRTRQNDGCDSQKLREYFENNLRKLEFQEDPIELIDEPEVIRNLKEIKR